MNNVRLSLCAIVLVQCVLQSAMAGPVPDGSATQENVLLDTGTGELAGTLLVPSTEGPVPVVLLIAGSGPTDRDGNNPLIPGKNNSLRQLAEGLARAQVASLRYDKRGVAGSVSAAISEAELRFDHMIDDARQWCALLQADDRFSSVTVVGHSEGAQVGANAAWLAAADGLVAVAGTGRPFFDVLRQQLEGNLPEPLATQAEGVMQSLEQGQLVADAPPQLAMLFRPSVQPYLISLVTYHPARDLARFDGPVAIIQGDRDTQVTVEDANLLAVAQPRARLLIIEGVNHLLKPVGSTNPMVQQASYSDSTLQVSSLAVEEIIRLTVEAEQYHQARMEALERTRALNQPTLPRESGNRGANLNTAAQVGSWARQLLAQGGHYKFGLAEGGYVKEGLFVQDNTYDCVSFIYRCTELARSDVTGVPALEWALRTRFAGADPQVVVGPDGKVNYDLPEHLDYSLDMIRTHIWGRDITANLKGAVTDSAGSSRYQPGSFQFVPSDQLDGDELAEGDILWLVLDPAHEKGAALRNKYGLVVGHIGIVLQEGEEVYLAHAASKPLPGHYETGGLVKVPLAEYLAAVQKFAGVIVTRF